jgi:hypothetical protein
MKTPRASLDWLAALWIGFGGLGAVTALASLTDPRTAYPVWPWTVAVSLGLIVAGLGVLQGRRWARSVAIVAVGAALLETMVWIFWYWPGTPVLVVSAVVHVIGLVALARAPTPRSLRTSRDGRSVRDTDAGGPT